MKEYSIYLLVGLALIFSSCEDKDMQASSPTFDVNVDKPEYAPGEEVKFNISGGSYGIGGALGAPYGLIIEDTIPGNIVIHDMSGTYKFVKSEYVEEYVFENGIRRIKLKDGRYQEIDFTGCAVDFSNPY